jgi:YegS/Rv2252/BmrU family lipid kinase
MDEMVPGPNGTSAPAPAPVKLPRFATVIANARAGRGRVGEELETVREALRRSEFDLRLDVTEAPGHATTLAREALARGERFLVAVGGDGTVNEVVNAMLEDDRPVAPDALLGVIAANSGNDVVRSFGLSQDPAEAVERFGAARDYAIDAGKATVTTKAGERTRYFLNMAQIGVGGAAAARAARLPRAMGRGRRFLGYWAGVAASRRPTVRLQGDRREFEGRVTNIVVANLQFTGDGLLLVPKAWPEDGFFDVQVYTGPRSDTFTLLPKMFTGEHVPHPHILEYRSRTLGISSDHPLAVEADGEPIGRTPATFEVIPGAIRLLV